MDESTLQRLIRKTIVDAGGQAEKIHADEYQRTGIADVIACYAGMYWAIEVKVGKAVPTPAQEMFLQEVREAGGYGSWVNSVETVECALRNWPDVCRYCLSPLAEGEQEVMSCVDGHGCSVGGQWIDFITEGLSDADGAVPGKLPKRGKRVSAAGNKRGRSSSRNKS